MTFKIGANFGASGGGFNFTVKTAGGTTLASGTARASGACLATVEGDAGDDLYFVLSDGREAGPVILDNPVSEAITAIESIETGTGTGAWTLRFTVLDADDLPVERATVRVQSGINNKRALTDAQGYLEIPVNNGNWHIAIDKSGYDGFTDDIIVTDDMDVPATLTAIVIPASSSPDLTTVYGTFGFLDVFEAGIAVSATIRGNKNAFLGEVLQNQEKSRQTTTSEGGAWTLDLAALPVTHFWELKISNKTLRLLVPDTPGVAVDVKTIIVD